MKKITALITALAFICVISVSVFATGETNTGKFNNGNDLTWSDYYMLTYYLAGWGDYQIFDFSDYDIDGDGRVTQKDRAIIARFLSGWGEEYRAYFTAAPGKDKPIELPIIVL